MCLSLAGSESKEYGRMLNENRSDLSDHGSIISDRDELQKVRILNLYAAPYLLAPALYVGMSGN